MSDDGKPLSGYFGTAEPRMIEQQERQIVQSRLNLRRVPWSVRPTALRQTRATGSPAPALVACRGRIQRRLRCHRLAGLRESRVRRSEGMGDARPRRPRHEREGLPRGSENTTAPRSLAFQGDPAPHLCPCPSAFRLCSVRSFGRR